MLNTIDKNIYFDRILARIDIENPATTVNLHDMSVKHNYTNNETIYDVELLKYYPRSVLIGEQGTGKTTILNYLERTFPGVYVVNLEGKSFHYVTKIIRDDEDAKNRIYIFDSLERHSDKDNIIHYISEHSKNWKGFLIASRSWAWKNEYTDLLDLSPIPINGSKDLKSISSIWNCDYLADNMYMLALEENYPQFMDQVVETGHFELLRTAVDGFALINSFKSSLKLPSTRFDLISQRINELITDLSAETTIQQQVILLEKSLCDIALTLTFTNEVITLFNLHNSINFDITKSQAQEIIQSEIIRVEENNITLIHSVYQDFLAASAIKNLPLFRIKPLLFSEERIVPYEYRGVLCFCLTHQSRLGRNTLVRYLLDKIDDTAVLALLDESGQLDNIIPGYFKLIFDYLIEQGFFPLNRISPDQQKFSYYLKYHRPPNPSEFIRPYLCSDNEQSVLWACAAIESWKNNDELSLEIYNLVTNEKTSSHVRITAFDLILLNKFTDPINQLKIFIDDFKIPAGDALTKLAELKLDLSSIFVILLDFIEKYKEISWIDVMNLGREYASLLNKQELIRSFAFFEDKIEDIYKRCPLFLNGFIQRAAALKADLPTPIIIKSLTDERDGSVIKYISSFGIERVWAKLINHLEGQPELVGGHIFISIVREFGMKIMPALKKMYPNLDDLITKPDFKLNRLLFSLIENPGYYNSFKPNADFICQQIQFYYPDFTFSQPKEIEPFTLDEIELFVSGQSTFEYAIIDCFVVNSNHINDEVLEKLVTTKQNIDDSSWMKLISWFVSEINALNYDAPFSRSREVALGGYLALVYALFKLGVSLSEIKGGIEALLKMCIFEGDIHRINIPGELLDQYYHTAYDLIVDVVNLVLLRSRELSASELTNGVYWIGTILKICKANDDAVFVDAIEKRLSEFLFFDTWDLKHCLDYLKKFKLKSYVEILGAYQKRYLTESTSSFESKNLELFAYHDLIYRGLCVDAEWAWTELESMIARHINIFLLESREKLIYPSSEQGILVMENWLLYLMNCKKNLYEKEITKKSDELDSVRDTIQNILSSMQDALGDKSTYKKLMVLRNNQEDWFIRREINFLAFQIFARGKKIKKEELFGLVSGVKSFINLDIRTEYELFEFVKEILDELQYFLDEGKGTLGFWQIKDSKFYPKTELDCQNVLGLLLELLARQYGYHISIHREEPVAGNRIDFKFLISQSNMRLSLPVELKVAHKDSGENWLIDPVETQLYSKYMNPTKMRYGIFLVLWFKSPEFNYPSLWNDKSEYVEKLTKKCIQISNLEDVEIYPVVLDLTAEKPILMRKISILPEFISQPQAKALIISVTAEPKSILELMNVIGETNKTKFKKNFLDVLLKEKVFEMTLPEKPTSSKQKYKLTQKGLDLLKQD